MRDWPDCEQAAIGLGRGCINFLLKGTVHWSQAFWFYHCCTSLWGSGSIELSIYFLVYIHIYLCVCVSPQWTNQYAEGHCLHRPRFSFIMFLFAPNAYCHWPSVGWAILSFDRFMWWIHVTDWQSPFSGSLPFAHWLSAVTLHFSEIGLSSSPRSPIRCIQKCWCGVPVALNVFFCSVICNRWGMRCRYVIDAP